MNELKPCPFCGEPFYFYYPNAGIEVRHESVACRLDGIVGWFETRYTAIEKLNNRPRESELEKKLEDVTQKALEFLASCSCEKHSKVSFSKFYKNELEAGCNQCNYEKVKTMNNDQSPIVQAMKEGKVSLVFIGNEAKFMSYNNKEQHYSVFTEWEREQFDDEQEAVKALLGDE